ncbi:NAD-P-binding protein [Amylostereum chailletii]|nr:NAD-P-binding protein [Amylostereum chailletii]
MSASKKLILVIGATGAQGRAIVDKLLAPAEDGSPSPYAVRGLTRDPTSRSAQELVAQGVELVTGSFTDIAAVEKALQGAYGAFVNTDGFNVSEATEIWVGVRIFETAKQVGTLKHYIWSGLDHLFKASCRFSTFLWETILTRRRMLQKGGYNQVYKSDHMDAKAIVSEWMASQPSDEDMTWTVITNGPYMDMLKTYMFGPMYKRADGTHVFVLPINKGHVLMVSVADIGFFARYSFDNPAATSGKDLEIASEMVDGETLARTFTKVTGKPAVFEPQTLDQWFTNLVDADMPVAYGEKVKGDGSTTWRKNFTGWWSSWKDDVVKRDMEWMRKINPNGDTLESWMRENNYDGVWNGDLLKTAKERSGALPNMAKLALYK